MLIDFWATWCPPCRKQMPAVERLARDVTLSDSVQIVSVNADDPTPDRVDKVRDFLAQNRYSSMLSLLDDSSASIAYDITSIPTLVILDTQGHVAAIEHGVHSEEQLRAKLASIAD